MVRHIFRISSLSDFLREDSAHDAATPVATREGFPPQLRVGEIRLLGEMMTTMQGRSRWRCEQHLQQRVFLPWLAQCRVTTMISERPAT